MKGFSFCNYFVFGKFLYIPLLMGVEEAVGKEMGMVCFHWDVHYLLKDVPFELDKHASIEIWSSHKPMISLMQRILLKGAHSNDMFMKRRPVLINMTNVRSFKVGLCVLISRQT